MGRPPHLLDFLTLLEPLDQYLREVKQITAAESIPLDEKMRLIGAAGRTLSTELEHHLETFTTQIAERRRELEAIVNPAGPDLLEQMQRLLRDMSSVQHKLLRRESLLRRWDRASPDEICREYEAALSAGDQVAAELFEAYVEPVLQRKGDQGALTAFRAQRERARDARLSPEQATAKRELDELKALEASVALLRSGLTSMLRLYGGGS